MNDSLVHTTSLMGTVVTFQIVGHGVTEAARAERTAAVARAVQWFHDITATCSRFEPQSELAQLTLRIGESVPVSVLLFEAVRFALEVAEATDGAFDPTVGHRMASLGFDREFRSGRAVHTGGGNGASYRDVECNVHETTITLLRPLTLDLGAVAKGMAIDMAARELKPFGDFMINAGGDLYLGGCNADGQPWHVGIRHPRDAQALVETLRVSNAAVCTSGDYERRRPTDPAVHHLLDPRSNATATSLVSATVMAPTAMVADALSTAAFVLGPVEGLALLERQGVEGLLLSPALDRFETRGMRALFGSPQHPEKGDHAR